jgi:hypothetical protein
VVGAQIDCSTAAPFDGSPLAPPSVWPRKLEPLQLGEAWQRGRVTVTQTITRRRAMIALVWAIAVYVGGRHLIYAAAVRVTDPMAHSVAGTGAVVGYLMFPAAGLVWLFFRWLDRKKAGAKLDGTDFAATLLFGGIVTLIAAKIVVSVVTLLVGLVI